MNWIGSSCWFLRGEAFGWLALGLGLVACSIVAATAQGAEDFAARAVAMKAELRDKVLPYWFDTAQDQEHGGYLLNDSLNGRHAATQKQVVTQARMVWGFARAHRAGFSDERRNYLAAARQGYHFLVDHFRDPVQGGYFWATDPAGKPVVERKILYGQAFVIYALVEYSRASGDKEPLRQALDLYETLQRHAHDNTNGGWREHFQRDWTPILSASSKAEVEIPGLKSSNTHLHLMEALAELYEATRDPRVGESLREALRINATWFYPQAPENCCLYRQPDWKPAAAAKDAGLSYGHNVEFAWLMIRAQTVLGQPPDWGHFDAVVGHALRCGGDSARGGLYQRGFGNSPACDTTKTWWVQAELLAALSDGLRHAPNAGYADALSKLLAFLWAHQVNAPDGIWLEAVSAEGNVLNPAKAHNWKANYHDVRAMLKFIDDFQP